MNIKIFVRLIDRAMAGLLMLLTLTMFTTHVASATELAAGGEKTYSITKITPHGKKRMVDITFTPNCSVHTLKNNIRFYPPVRVQWYNSKPKDETYTYSLKANFRAGQNYSVVIPQDIRCNTLTYKSQVTSFKMPDLQSSIIFSEKGTVIERDSRQMIHVDLINVEELLFQGAQIPPIVAPFAGIEESKRKSFAEVLLAIEVEQERLTHLLSDMTALQPFIGKIEKEKQLFFPGKEKNKKDTYSVPLAFRKEKEKGGVMLINFKNNATTNKAKTAARLFRVTDLSLTYKKSDDSMLIWVTSLNSGKPVEDVHLMASTSPYKKGESFYNLIPLGVTDNKGTLIINKGEILDHILTKDGSLESKSIKLRDMRNIVAVSATDSTYIHVTTKGNIKPEGVYQTMQKSQSRGILKGHLFTERGIYRPGERVHFKGTVREFKGGKIAPPAELEPTFQIINSKGEKIYEKKISLNEFGTASDSLTIKTFFPLGTYTIKMKANKNSGGTADRSFEVQEFRPPRHFAEVSFKHEKKRDKSYVNLDREVDIIKCRLAGVYYAGGPVKHGKVRWKVYYRNTDFQRKNYPDHSFGNVIGKKKELLESGESILDEKGELSVTIPISEDVMAGIYAVEVFATVVDFDGRASSESGVYQVEPDYLIGIRKHKDSVQAGDSGTVKAIVIDKNGEKLDRGKLRVDVMRQGYSYVRKRNEYGNVYWDYKDVWRKDISTSIAIENGEALFDFEFLNGGNYLIKFTYKGDEGKSYISSTEYNVKGYFYGYDYENRNRSFDKLAIYPEKSKYLPGETLKVFFNPRKSLSSLLMTIEREGVLEHRIIEPRAGQQFVEIPVEASHAPNIYVSLLGTVARDDFPVYNGQFDDDAPAFLFGVVNIEVKNDAEELTLAINEDEAYLKAKPGEKVTLNLSAKDHLGAGVISEMAVCVVDESVLSLTGFKTPTLETLTKFTAPLSVFTGESRADLLRQTPFNYLGKNPFSGGGGIDKRPDAVTAKVRKDFSPVAYFNPSVMTDEAGNAQVSFTLPDTMTTYRVYAVAVDKGSKFASEQRGLLAVKDFYIEPGIPRFFTKGDKFKFSVSAFNKTSSSSYVDFSLGENKLIKMSTKSLNYPLAGYDRSLLPIEGEAVKPGNTKLFFSAQFEDKNDAIEVKIPVNSGHLLWNDVLFGMANKREKLSYSFPKGTEKIKWDELNPDDVEVFLTLSGSPFLRMTKGLRYLLKYPYGCIEQTSSGILPLAVLRSLIQEGLLPGTTIEETDKFLKKGIERLFSMQTSSGGFGYWPGNYKPHKWGSIYATVALSHARAAGLELPEKEMAKAMSYLKKLIKSEENKESVIVGFAAYVLAMNGALDENLFKELYLHINESPRQSALLILLSAKLTGFLPEEEIKKETLSTINRSWNRGAHDIFHARYREPAVALLTGSTIIPDDPAVGKLAKQLLGGISKKGIWTSTSDTGWSLVALGNYFKDATFGDKPVEVTLTQEGWPSTSMTLKSKGQITYKIEPKSFLKKPNLAIMTDSDKDLVYMLSLTFPRIDFAKDGYSNGFIIHKTIENSDGTKKIKVGDVVKVKVDIEMNNSHYSYIVLDDPLPAGLVAINSALKTEEHVEDDNKNEGNYWSYWDYEGGFYRFVPNHFEMRDDRVLAFKDRAWRGKYQYSYYARAVSEGQFVIPATKVQLMYDPEVASYTPVGTLVIEGR